MACLASLADRSTIHMAMATSTALRGDIGHDVAWASFPSRCDGVFGSSRGRRLLFAVELDGRHRNPGSCINTWCQRSVTVTAKAWGPRHHASLARGVEWSRISDHLVIGPCPRGPQEVRTLQQLAGADAIICLQSAEDLEGRSISWTTVNDAANAAEMLAMQLPMKEFDAEIQASLLPDALSLVEFLMGLGYNVYVCCGSGDLIAPLLALGHLTLADGERYDKAIDKLLKIRPSSKPMRLAWDRVVAKLTEGMSARQKELAHREFRRRLLAREEGSHAKDCQVALEQVAHEAFTRRLLPQKSLALEMNKAVDWDAKRAQVEMGQQLQAALRSSNARASAAEAAAKAASEQIKFFFRQLASLKEKEEASRLRAKELEKQTAALEKQLKEATAENERLQRAMRQQEVKAQDALARLTAALKRGGTGMEQLQQMKALEASLADTEGKLQASDEKNSFLVRQLKVSRDSEQRAKAAARAADTRYTKILRQVEDLARREAAARKAASNAVEKYRAVNRDLIDLGATKEGPEAVMEIRVRLEALTKQVAELKVREEAAEAATAEAMEKLAGVVKKLERAEEREEQLVRSELAAKERAEDLEQRMGALQQELAEAKLAASSASQMVSKMSAEVAELRQREAAADDAIKRYESLREQVDEMEKRDNAYKGEIAAATQRIAALSELISTLSKREGEMNQALEEANQKIEFLSERVGELVQREEVARAAAESAEGKVVVLGQKVGELEASEASAVREAEMFKTRLVDSEERERQARQAADAANSRVKELFAKVAEVEGREQEAKTAADEAYRKLEEVARMMALQTQVPPPARAPAQAQTQADAESQGGAGSQADVEEKSVEVEEEEEEEEEEKEKATRAAAPWWDKFVFDPRGNKEKELVGAPAQGKAQNGASRKEQAVLPPAMAAAAAPAQAPVPPVPLPPEPREAGGVPGRKEGNRGKEGGGLEEQSGLQAEEGPLPAVALSVAEEEQADLAEKRKVLGATLEECVGLFVSQVVALKEREVASRDALTAANKRIEALSGQVSVLAKREEAANALAEEFASQVTELVTRIAELNEELEAAEQREADLAEALTVASTGPSSLGTDAGNGLVAIAPKKEARVLVAELEEARKRADELAAEVEDARKMAEEISESIFGARKRSLQEQQQREELVAEVVALKEAMVLMKEREGAITSWKQQLLEQADYLSSLMDEGDVVSSTRERLRAAVLDIQTPV